MSVLDGVPRTREEVEAWARERGTEGDPTPLEFLWRLHELEMIYRRAERLVALSLRPEYHDQGPRIDHLRERLGERSELGQRKLARTMRAGWGRLPPNPIFLYVISEHRRSYDVDGAESELRNESRRRRLARNRRKGRTRTVTLPQTVKPGPVTPTEPRAQR